MKVTDSLICGYENKNLGNSLLIYSFNVIAAMDSSLRPMAVSKECFVQLAVLGEVYLVEQDLNQTGQWLTADVTS